MYQEAQWLSGRVLDSRSRGCGNEPHLRHCIASLSKTLYLMLSTGATQEDPSQHDSFFSLGPKKSKTNKHNSICIIAAFLHT